MGCAASSLGFGALLFFSISSTLGEIYSDTDWSDYPI
jgi:hypothetical protein